MQTVAQKLSQQTAVFNTRRWLPMSLQPFLPPLLSSRATQAMTRPPQPLPSRAEMGSEELEALRCELQILRKQ